MKIVLRQVLHWPPQPTTIAGVAIIGVGLFLAPGDRLAGISYRTHTRHRWAVVTGGGRGIRTVGPQNSLLEALCEAR